MVENRKHKQSKRTYEPKITEIERMVCAFRDAHGHEKIMRVIKQITKNIDTHEPLQTKQVKSQKNQKEPKIAELEKIFRLFERDHGREKLMHSLKEAAGSSEYNKKSALPEHVIYNGNETIATATSKIKRFLNTLKTVKNLAARYFKGCKNAMKKRRYRYPVGILSLFLIIYILFNIPVIYSRISWHKPEDTQKLIVTTQEVVQEKMADSAALAPGEAIPNQSTIIIPKISVRAPIIYADTTDENKVHDELHDGVVHYSGTAMPGEVGNSFITGHSSNYWWDTGKYNYIFVNLDRLEPGDKVITYYNGKKFVYTVRDKIVVEPTDMSVLASADTPVLSLMTCTPPGTSWKRLVVRLDLTDPVYHKPTTVTKEKVVEVPRPKEQKKGLLGQLLSLILPN